MICLHLICTLDDTPVPVQGAQEGLPGRDLRRQAVPEYPPLARPSLCVFPLLPMFYPMNRRATSGNFSNEKRQRGRSGLPMHSEKSVFSLSCSLSFLFSLYTGLFIVLTLTDFRENTCASAFSLKPSQGAFQRFIFTNAYFRHLFPPSLRYNFQIMSLVDLQPANETFADKIYYSIPETQSQLFYLRPARNCASI